MSHSMKSVQDSSENGWLVERINVDKPGQDKEFVGPWLLWVSKQEFLSTILWYYCRPQFFPGTVLGYPKLLQQLTGPLSIHIYSFFARSHVRSLDNESLKHDQQKSANVTWVTSKFWFPGQISVCKSRHLFTFQWKIHQMGLLQQFVKYFWYKDSNSTY